MNDIILLLWLGDVAEGFKFLLMLIAVIATVIVGFIYPTSFTFREAEGKAVRRIVHRAIAPATLAIALLSVMIPSKQWFYIAAGGTAVVKGLDSEIGKKVQLLVTKKLDESLGEVK